MINYPSLNRRHKVGLFLVLLAAGISLFFEASAKQTTGIVLLGLAATWLLSTISVRLFWLLSSFLVCLVGVIVGGKPVVDDWKSFQESVQSYDRAIADLHEAVTKARPLYVVKSEPLPSRSDGSSARMPAIDYDALAKKYGAISSSPPSNRPQDFTDIRPLPGVIDYNPVAKKWVHAVDISAGLVPKTRAYLDDQGHPMPSLPPGYTLDTTVEIPTTTQTWERPDLGLLPPGATLVSGSIGTTLSFPNRVDEEELISTLQNQLLQPRPKFSLRASFISNRLYSLIGFGVLTAGLFSLGWFVRSLLRAKRGHAQQVA